MRVQLLFFPGCPNVAAARAVLQHCLSSMGLPETFEEIDVTSPGAPEHLRQWGSPTILVDGVDVGGQTGPTGVSCRLYEAGDAPSSRGVPPKSLIRTALDRARGRI